MGTQATLLSNSFNIVNLIISFLSVSHLDVGVFGPLAKAYRSLVSRGNIFGAQRVNNYKFLLYYMDVQKTISQNIPGAWHKAGLIPLNPDKILEHLRPKTPPTASFTDENGRSISIPLSGELAAKVNEVVSQLLDVCASPLRQSVLFIKETALTAIADRATFQTLNQGLVEKATQQRRKNTRKHCGLVC
jgi:hypothetical protein